MSERSDWEDPRVVLTRYGLHAKRRYSQNFLVSRDIVERIARALDATPHDLVVELGAGLGTLTSALAKHAATVVAIDRDPDMLRVLEAEFRHSAGVRVRPGDATVVDLDVEAAAHGAPILVAGNLPYAVTGAVLRRLTDQRAHVARAVLMVQREVRDRLLAAPGTREYGALTVFVQAAFQVEPCFLVPASAFHPAPRVTSAVFRLIPHATPVADEGPTFRALVKTTFATRRKTLGNSLRALGLDEAERQSALKRVAIDAGIRGETLSVAQFAALAEAIDATRTQPR